jgi:hypothetical protein
MTNLTKAWAVGLLALVLPVTVAAQQPNARARAANNTEDQGQNRDRFLILHALNKAIDGSGLQFAAEFARGGRQQDNQGQDADNRRDRRDDDQRDRRDRRDDDQRDRNADNRQADNQNRQRDQQGDQQGDQQLASQLEQQARQEFAASDRLLDDAGNDIKSDEGAGAARAEDRTAWTRRLHTVANQYATTLRSLAAVSGRDDRASDSVGNRDRSNDDQNRRNVRADRDQENRSDANQNAQQRQRLNRGDVARVILINHAVRQAAEAYGLNQWSNRQQADNTDARGGSAQRLQERARQLEADSNQILQRVQASANQQQANDGNQRNRDQDRDENENRNQRNRDQDQQGRASVRELAQQAQQLVDTLQRSNASEPRGR